VNDARRRLPAVHAILARPELTPWIAGLGHEVVARLAREVVEAARARAAEGDGADSDLITAEVVSRLSSDRPCLRPVINATGILIHTGLGRSPLGDEAMAHIARVAAGYSSLEIDLETGTRGRRTSAVAALLRELTGAEAAAVVNNNAAATLIALRALGAGREVVVSRGQLVEIGGSYRLPEVFEASGARLREVGTTNKTRLSDYARAIGPEAAGLMRVHPSNYRVEGFTETVEIGELAALARERGIWCIDDIGSGALAPGLPPGVRDEPTIRGSLDAGAYLVLCSGDKLLGGPQCGLILGRRELVDRITADPMMRALRVDKMTLAALEWLLRIARDPGLARRSIPLWRMLDTPPGVLRGRAEAICERLRSRGIPAREARSESFAGGGSTPAQAMESWAVRLELPLGASGSSAVDIARALRLGTPAVFGRVEEGDIWLDLRAVAEADDEPMARRVEELLAQVSSGPVLARDEVGL
jgi:L-seryl-tRNA(Ser) seleniumtransferase